MAKKNNKSDKNILESYKGSISTIFVTAFILFVGFFLPMFSAQELDKAREGEGYYQPQEDIIWDLDSLSDFENVAYIGTSKDEQGDNVPSGTSYSPADQGTSQAVYWYYHSKNPSLIPVNVIDGANDLVSIVQGVTIDDLESDTFVDNYGSFALIPNARSGTYIYPHELSTQSIYVSERFKIYFDLEKELFSNQEAKTIRFYSEMDNSNFPSGIDFRMFYRTELGSYRFFNFETYTPNQMFEYDLSMMDLININSLPGSNGYFLIEFALEQKQEEFTTSTNINFDLQLTGLVAKENSITILSVWFVVESIGNILLAIVMTAPVSIGSLGKRLGLVSTK